MSVCTKSSPRKLLTWCGRPARAGVLPRIASAARSRDGCAGRERVFGRGAGTICEIVSDCRQEGGRAREKEPAPRSP